MTKDLAYMLASPGAFGNPELALDRPLQRVKNPDLSVTETWWWSCHVPKRSLNCEIYLWLHSNLNVMSGGVWIFQGVKQHYLQCEHFNFMNWLPRPQVSGEGIFCPELNLRINILDDMQVHEILYSHPSSDTALRLAARAVQPPVMRPNNAHFEQAQHLRGMLRLNGEDIPIECMAMRDRSWGEPRPETSVQHPPILWGVGVSSDGGTSFNINATDDPERDPLTACYGLTKTQVLKAGWIHRRGELSRIRSISKLTTRAQDGLQAKRIDCIIHDEHGRESVLTGEVIAAVRWSPWPNMHAAFGQLVDWQLDGQQMYGEAQEVFWSDSVKKMYRAAADILR